MFHVLVFFAVSMTSLIDATSNVEVVNLERWAWISKGYCPHSWVLNFYSKKTESRSMRRDKPMEREFAEAAQMLQGIVKTGAYAVGPEFPSFIRVPSVLMYMPNSSHPYVFELKVNKGQVKRPAYALVKCVKERLMQRISYPLTMFNPFIAQTRMESSEDSLKEIPSQKIIEALNGASRKAHLVLLCDNIEREVERSALVDQAARVLYSYHRLNKDVFEYGYTNFSGVRDQISPLTDHLTVPSIIMCGSREDDVPKIYVYEGRLDVQDLLSWCRDRLVDVGGIPNNAVRIGISRDNGFVGQAISVEGQKFLLTIP